MTDMDIAVRALSLLDLTSLGDGDDDDALGRLCGRATGPWGHVAAVCVWPRFVPLCRDALEGTGVRVATVVNFPDGGADIDQAAAETRAAVAQGADEVDMVMPYAAWLAGKRDLARELVAACKDACGDRVLLKVILETGRLGGPRAISDAARDAIASGADFIKTSTGKIEVSATVKAARAMLAVIAEAGRPVGFKAAGGIRTKTQAGRYLALADRLLGPEWAAPGTFRFGASSLLDDLLKKLPEN